MRRGVFYTPGLVLLAFTVVAVVAASRGHQAVLAADVLAGARSLRDYNGYAASAEGLAEVVRQSSGVEAAFGEYSVSFVEELPNQRAAGMGEAVDLYAAFAEERSGELSFSVSGLKDTLTLVAEPVGLNYTHPVFGGRVAVVEAGMANVTGYGVAVSVGRNVTNCTWSNPAGDNTVTLSVDVQGVWGSCTKTFQADPSLASVVEANDGEFRVTYGPSGRLVVESNFPESLNVTSNVYLGAGNRLRGVYLPSGAVSWTGAGGSLRRGQVRVF